MPPQKAKKRHSQTPAPSEAPSTKRAKSSGPQETPSSPFQGRKGPIIPNDNPVLDLPEYINSYALSLFTEAQVRQPEPAMHINSRTYKVFG